MRRFASQTDGEARVAQILKEKFPQAAAIKVVDISGSLVKFRLHTTFGRLLAPLRDSESYQGCVKLLALPAKLCLMIQV